MGVTVGQAGDALDQLVDSQLSNKVEHPNEHANHKNACDDDQGVFNNLLGGGPDDLLQLALELTEVSANGTPGSLEPVFLFVLSHLFASPYLVSL